MRYKFSFDYYCKLVMFGYPLVRHKRPNTSHQSRWSFSLHNCFVFHWIGAEYSKNIAGMVCIYWSHAITSDFRVWSHFISWILHYFCTKTISCNLDAILQRVEWITLIFFGAMFITMECLARLGLIKWIGKQTEEIILLFDKDYRLALAIIIVLWVSWFKWQIYLIEKICSPDFKTRHNTFIL